MSFSCFLYLVFDYLFQEPFALNHLNRKLTLEPKVLLSFECCLYETILEGGGAGLSFSNKKNILNSNGKLAGNALPAG